MADAKKEAVKPQMVVVGRPVLTHYVVLHALVCVGDQIYPQGAMVDGKELDEWLPMLVEQGAIAPVGM